MSLLPPFLAGFGIPTTVNLAGQLISPCLSILTPPAMISVQNTIAIVDFQSSLDDGFATSFLELAYHAWEVGVRLENVQPHPSVYSTLIRKAINFCNRRFPDVPVHPGIIKTTC